MIRSLALTAGLALVGAAAHVNILACGGYAQPTAVITLALAIGVAVGSVAIGNAAQNKRRTLAVFIALGLLCGEGYALIATGERTISARDASVAPITAAVEVRKLAEARVASAELGLAGVAATSPRLEAAIAAKAAAETRAMDDASKKSCAANCRALLEAATATAAREVDAARAEITGFRSNAELRLTEARAAVAALPARRSASPLADRLGVAAWALDLLAAGLLSIGVNGLGAALIALSAHGRGAAHGGAAHGRLPGLEVAAVMAPTVAQLDPPKSIASITSAAPSPAHDVLGMAESAKERHADSQPPSAPKSARPVVKPKPIAVDPEPAVDTAPAAEVSPSSNVVTLAPPGRVAQFLVDAVEPSANGRIEVADLYGAYRSWCAAQQVSALGAELFGDDLQAAIDVVGLEIKTSRGKVFLLKVKLSDGAIARCA
jgi:hypothetical protein